MSNENYRSELDDWTELWDIAQEMDGFENEKKVDPSPIGDGVDDSHQDTYWNFVDFQQLNENDGVNAPDPFIHRGTKGPDEKLDPLWVKEDLLKDITSLKDQLYSVENKLAGFKTNKDVPETTDKEDDLYSQIESMKEKINNLSDKLGK